MQEKYSVILFKPTITQRFEYERELKSFWPRAQIPL